MIVPCFHNYWLVESLCFDGSYACIYMYTYLHIDIYYEYIVTVCKPSLPSPWGGKCRLHRPACFGGTGPPLIGFCWGFDGALVGPTGSNFWLPQWNDTVLKLLGGLEHVLWLPIYWECHHPNWLIFFRRGWSTTNQLKLDTATSQGLSYVTCLHTWLAMWKWLSQILRPTMSMGTPPVQSLQDGAPQL